MNILKMKNPVQHYAWGSHTFIQELTGIGAKSSKPIAELWMGGHPSAPSMIINGKWEIPLNEMLAESPSIFMGEKCACRFGGNLPFLLKVLAAEAPLSIQVHPNKAQAMEGFDRENQAGLAPGAPNRNYKDANHKPELLVALTPFSALCGFREAQQLSENLKRYLWHCQLESLNAFLGNPDAEHLKLFYADLMLMKANDKDALIAKYLDKLRHLKPVDKQDELLHRWTLKLRKSYPHDIGLLSPLLFNIISIRPLQGLYLPAGVLHAYLEGAGMEIMAASDNVLRGGLTPKYIDIPELLKVVDFTAEEPRVIAAVKIQQDEYTYKTPADEFCLSYVKHKSNKTSIFPSAECPEILYCTEGAFKVEHCSQILALKRGESLFVPAETEGYKITGKGFLFRARSQA